MQGCPDGSVVNPPAMQETWVWSLDGRSSREGNNNQFQYSCLGNPMNRGAWQAILHRITKEVDMTWWLTMIFRLVKEQLWFWTMNFISLQLGSNTSLPVKIGTITVNKFCYQEMFVYSCSTKNLSFRIWPTLGKHFLPLAGCGSIFPAKSCWDTWKNGRWLVRGQVNMVSEAKLCSPIHSTFEASVVWHAVRYWAHSVDQRQLQALAVLSASQRSAEHTSLR